MIESNVAGDVRSGQSQRRKTKSANPKSTGTKQRRRRIYNRMFSIGAGLDLPLLFLIIILLSIGLVMLFSASYAYSLYNFGTSYYFISNQAVYAVIGLIVMFALSLFDYHQFHRLAWPIYWITGIMLLMTVVFRGTAIAPLKGGTASRWLNLGIVEFQPSEIAKFALILVFAHMISQRVEKMGRFKEGFLSFMGVLGVYAAMIVLERHLSATIIIVIVAVILMVIGGTKFRYIAAVGAIGIAVGIALLLFSDSFAYATERIQGWLDPFGNTTDTWQTKQSLYAIGSGQLWGVGLGQSRQKYLYLPEPQNDFIFAIVCEELGFIGALFIIILFSLLIWRGIYVSLHARDKFGMILGLGISFQVGLQVILNIAVVTNTIPNTGIGLPFFSSGGTALLILLAQMGVLLQISRSSSIEKT